MNMLELAILNGTVGIYAGILDCVIFFLFEDDYNPFVTWVITGTVLLLFNILLTI